MLAFMEDLNQLQEDAKSAGDEATEYHLGAVELRDYFCVKDCKMCVIFILGALSVVGLLIFAIVKVR